jgi:dTDP-4-dehydrorhamnose 3,5-epimerase
MPFAIESEHLGGAVKVIKPQLFPDERGFFMEVYRADHFRALGITDEAFVQDNHSRSVKGVLRGLHFQYDPPLAKLMRVTVGRALLVAVDIRLGSPTLGQWAMVEASDENHLQLWAPASFARGFYVLSDWAEIQYKCTAIYNKDGEGGIRWDDPQINLAWGAQDPILSPKDRAAPTLAAWLKTPAAQHFRYDKA